jgi:hypothetical protein
MKNIMQSRRIGDGIQPPELSVKEIQSALQQEAVRSVTKPHQPMRPPSVP